MKLLLFVLLFPVLTCPTRAEEPIPAPPGGTGQITVPVEWISDPGVPVDEAAPRFAAQQTPNGKLVLTASNGFFDPGIRAGGDAATKDSVDKRFIDPDYERLENWTQPGSTLRWHLWVKKPGKLYGNAHLVVPKALAGSELSVTLADSTHLMNTRTESDPALPQGEPFVFDVEKSGWHTLEVRLKYLTGAEVGQVHRLELFGPAVVEASVLRTRWRPAACHARFSSSGVEEPQLWVMSSRSSPKAAVSSYSPITTPFGYFGSSFNADGTSSGSANFSLWSYGRGKPTPQAEWSHMLAVGSPLATFGSFGHEGSGVKLRGDWAPFGEDSKEVTLALRGEPDGPWVRWFGYYLDPATKRFRLFAAAAKWKGEGRMRSLNPGAFVEQPGPPNRRRCGDLIRDIHRRGWMLDADKRWHVVDTMSTGKSTALAAKHWGVTEDGWFSMGMGGIPHQFGPGKPVKLDVDAQPLPDWLGPEAIDDLFRLPADIGPRTVTDVTRTSAKVHVPLSPLALAPGESATITVYHGPEDCLTFHQDLGYRETKTRFWSSHSDEVLAKDGDNVIALNGLTPGQTRFFRILITGPRGGIWSFRTEQFTTLP
jgi:hypothetical protein